MWYLPVFTLSFVCAVWIEMQYDPVIQYPWFLPACILMALAIVVVCRHLKQRNIFISLLLGGCTGLAYAALFLGMVHAPLASLDGQKTRISAMVTDYAEQYEDTQRVALKIDTQASGISFWMPSFYTMAYLPLTETALEPGDQIKATVSFYEGSNNGGFDRASYYSGRNVHILANCKNAMTLEVQKATSIPWTVRPLIWAHALKQNLHDTLSDTDAAFLKALLFGDKDELSLSIQQDFQKAGLSHVMAVSGMHVGFLVMFFLLVLGRRIGLCASLLALVIFVPMTGAPPSVIRAAIMYAFVAIGFFLRREHSTLHSLCTALLVLLFYNPYALQSLSLQLSFLATLGLILFGTPLQSKMLAPLKEYECPFWIYKICRLLVGAVACSICSSIFTVPVLLHTFGYVSVASVLANLLTVGVFAVLFVEGFIVCFGIPILSSILAIVIHGLCIYVFAVAHGIGNIQPLLLYGDFWYVQAGIWLLYGVVIAAWLLKSYLPFSYAAALACTILLLTLGINADTLSRKYEIQMFSSGYGQCIAVSYAQRGLAVIDCATSQNAVKSLTQYMDWNGFSQIDLLIITSLDQTHARDLPELLQTVPVGQLILPSGYTENDFSAEVLQLAEGTQIPVTVWKGEGERPVGNTQYGLSLIGGTPKKLGVRIQQGHQEILTLHSFTPKMLEELSQLHEVTGDSVILSESFLDEAPDELIQQLQARQIYLPTSYEENGEIAGIPIQTTKQSGDLLFREILPRGGV
ncbi:MAG: ComEC/Rec2 family competence protein [Butyricicoccus sp.]|nr:ComEC/Rec2 family competence protein [Butyricicoccus sp.]